MRRLLSLRIAVVFFSQAGADLFSLSPSFAGSWPFYPPDRPYYHAQLYKVTSQVGEGLSFTSLGPQQIEVLSSSTCLMAGVFYYVGAPRGSRGGTPGEYDLTNMTLYGLSTRDGAVVHLYQLPYQVADQVVWRMACQAGAVYLNAHYASFHGDEYHAKCKMLNPYPDNRTIWRHNASAGTTVALGRTGVDYDDWRMVGTTVALGHIRVDGCIAPLGLTPASPVGSAVGGGLLSVVVEEVCMDMRADLSIDNAA